MSYRNRTGLYGVLASTLLVALACGGLDDVKIVITDGGSGGVPNGGNSNGGAKPSGGDTSEAGAAGEVSGAGSGGAAGEEAMGGEGGEFVVPDPMPGPPSVTAVFPKDQTVDFDPLGSVRLVFSEPLDPNTVTGASVQIKDGSGAVVDGALSYSDAVITFRPKGRLNLLGNYTVNVSTAVTDGTGTPLERPFMSSFTVQDGTWRRDENPLTANTSAYDRNSALVLASDGVSRAVAVWAQYSDGGSNYDIFAALFNQGKGWATPVKVNTNASRCQYPSVSMNASGNLIVGWVEYDSVTVPTPAQPYSVQIRRNIGGTWDTTSTRIDTVTAPTYILNHENVTVAMRADGHAHVAWDAWDYNTTSNDYGVFTRHADAAGVWDPTVVSLTGMQVSTGAGAPTLAFDQSGNGFAAYQFVPNSPAKVNTIVMRYLATTNKWGTSAVASTPSDAYALPVALTTNPAGEAILAYTRATAIDATNTNYDIMGAYFNKDWKAPVVISSTATSLSSSKAQLASATWTGASFLVAWAQSAGSVANIYANEFKTAWGATGIISDGNHGSTFPWLTSDGRGNALAVWTQSSDTAPSGSLAPFDVVFSRFLGATDRWSDPGHASSALAGYRYAQAATLADGTVVAAWQRLINNYGNIKALAVNGVLENSFQ